MTLGELLDRCADPACPQDVLDVYREYLNSLALLIESGSEYPPYERFRAETDVWDYIHACRQRLAPGCFTDHSLAVYCS